MVPGRYSYSSNRLECLATSFVRVFGGPEADPLAPVWVIVPNAGVARWLGFQVADQSGVSCNYDFLFPGHFVERLAGFSDQRSTRSLDVRDWVWPVYEILADSVSLGGDNPLPHYLEDGDPLKRMQLAFALARFLDQACLYRYEQVLSWEREGKPVEWQGRLWKKLCQRLPHLSHPARSLESLRSECAHSTPPMLPRRVAFFAVSALPPLYFDFVNAISQRCEVHLFHLQPSALYFGDHHDPKQQARKALSKTKKSAETEAVANPLLASWGAQGRDFLNLLLDMDFNPVEETFVPGDDGHLLQQLQNDILEDRNRSLTGGSKLVWEPDDRSLSLGVCHSPLREVEVLYDVILDALEKDPELQPRDILVLTPSMGDYVPLVEAVFGLPEDPRLRLPYSLADRSPQAELPLVDVLLRVVALAGGRVTSREIMELLESPVFRERFQLMDEDLVQIREWIVETGIRWGLDAEGRKSLLDVGFEENSWSFGIKRLLLGLAVPGNRGTTFSGIMPYPEMEGDRLVVLERFLEAFSVLENFLRQVARPRSLKSWVSSLEYLLGQLTPEKEHYNRSRLLIQDALIGLGNSVEGTGDEAVPVQAVHYFLQRYFEDSYRSGGFLNGGITFAELTPLRSVPAKMICVLGLNDLSFPRHETPSPFRLANDRFRPGDRDIRKQDQYLFLETLLSARQKLYLSYTGFSLRNPGQSPPSVLVSQLFDYLEMAVAWPDERGAQVLVAEHAMTVFSPLYFEPESPVFSYSHSALQGARTLAGKGAFEPMPTSVPDLKPEDTDEEISLEELCQAILDPTAYFASSTLGIKTAREKELLLEDEPMTIEWREDYRLKTSLLGGGGEGEDFDSLYERERSLGILPIGSQGRGALYKVSRSLEPLRERWRELTGHGQERYLPVNLSLGQDRLTGQVGPVYGNKVVLVRPATLKAKDLLKGWLTALAASSLRERASYPDRVVVLAQDGEYAFPVPVDSAEVILLDLLQLRHEARRTTLPLFPHSGYAYAWARWVDNKDPVIALNLAKQKWDSWGYEEKSSGFYPSFWGGGYTLDSRFELLVERLWSPLCKNLEVVS